MKQYSIVITMSTQQVPTTRMRSYDSSVWFITGVNRGLGRCLTEEVLKRGGKVAGTVRKLSNGDDLVGQHGDRVWCAELDLSKPERVANTFTDAVAHYGRIDAVVSNAAYSLIGAAEELELDAIKRIIDTNLTASIELARAAVAHMRPHGGGRIIQMSSGAGQASWAGLSLYCATKWGIEGFFDSLAQEVSTFGIQTTLVEPGAIRTDFGASGILSTEIEAYSSGFVGVLRQMAKGGYVAPGDPKKMAAAIVDLFQADKPPARLALGPDVYEYIRAGLLGRLEQLEACKDLTMSTNYDDLSIS